MDTLTHALSGALLGRATAPKTPGATQLPIGLRSGVGFCAAAFPDSDFVINFFDSFAYLTAHRGITHSLIVLPLWGLLLSLLFTLVTRRRYPWQAFIGICLLGIGAHIAGDVITSFGTMIFAPFSYWRVQLPTTFIIDLYFTGIIVVGLLFSLLARDARSPAIVGLCTLGAYIGFQAVQHYRAVGVGERFAADKPALVVHALPQPLSPFNWMVVVQEERAYHIAYINLIRDQARMPAPDASWFARLDASYRPVSDAQWVRTPIFGNDRVDLAKMAWQSPALEQYRHFVMLPAVLRIDERDNFLCVWFHDLRFVITGRTGGPFRYGACRSHAKNPWRLFQLETDDQDRERAVPIGKNPAQ